MVTMVQVTQSTEAAISNWWSQVNYLVIHSFNFKLIFRLAVPARYNGHKPTVGVQIPEDAFRLDPLRIGTKEAAMKIAKVAPIGIA